MGSVFAIASADVRDVSPIGSADVRDSRLRAWPCGDELASAGIEGISKAPSTGVTERDAFPEIL